MAQEQDFRLNAIDTLPNFIYHFFMNRLFYLPLVFAGFLGSSDESGDDDQLPRSGSAEKLCELKKRDRLLIQHEARLLLMESVLHFPNGEELSKDLTNKIKERASFSNSHRFVVLQREPDGGPLFNGFIEAFYCGKMNPKNKQAIVYCVFLEEESKVSFAGSRLNFINRDEEITRIERSYIENACSTKKSTQNIRIIRSNSKGILVRLSGFHIPEREDECNPEGIHSDQRKPADSSKTTAQTSEKDRLTNHTDAKKLNSKARQLKQLIKKLEQNIRNKAEGIDLEMNLG